MTKKEKTKEPKTPEVLNITREAYDIFITTLIPSGKALDDRKRITRAELLKALNKEPGKNYVPDLFHTPAGYALAAPALYRAQIGEADFYLQTFKAPGRPPVNCYMPVGIVDEAPPNFPAMRRCYWGSYVMAMAAQSERIIFTAKQKLLLLGYTEKEIKDHGGQLYAELHAAEIYLASTTFHYKDKDIEIVAHPYSLLYRRKDSTYEATLSKDFAPGADFTNQGIERDAQGKLPKYVKIKTADILKNKGSIHERNFREFAYTWHGLPSLVIYGETLLNATGATADTLKRKERRKPLIEMALNVLKEQGFTQLRGANKNPKGQTKYRAGDVRGWKFYFRPPQYTKQGQRYDIRQPEYQAFIEKFLEWHCRPIHFEKQKQKNTPQQIKESITNTLATWGLADVERIFNAVDKSANPHPLNFWKAFKEFKQDMNQRAARLKMETENRERQRVEKAQEENETPAEYYRRILKSRGTLESAKRYAREKLKELGEPEA